MVARSSSFGNPGWEVGGGGGGGGSKNIFHQCFNIFCWSVGDVRKINVTLKEVNNCKAVCLKVEWDEVFDDYRTVLFYIVSYREA